MKPMALIIAILLGGCVAPASDYRQSNDGPRERDYAACHAQGAGLQVSLFIKYVDDCMRSKGWTKS